CMEPSCIILAADILSSLDTTQDPCNNFYNFANNGWLRDNPLPADKGGWGQLSALDQQNQHVMQRILDSYSGNSTSGLDQYDQQTLQKLSDMYSSCTNLDQLDSIGQAPLENFVGMLRGLYRGNATTSGANAREGTQTSKGLTAALAFLHLRGVDSLFGFFIDGDAGLDPNHMVLWFNQPSFGLPAKEYFQDNSTMQLYESVAERLLTIFNDSSNSDIPGLVKQVLDFESKMAQASLDPGQLLDPIATYNPFNTTDFVQLLPQVDFPTYFSAFNNQTSPSRIIVNSPEYAKAVSQILSETPDQVVESYLVFQAALSLSPYLGMGTDAWQAQRSLVEFLNGIQKGAVSDRGETCIGLVVNSLGFAMGRYFVNATFPGDSREKGTTVISNVVKAFVASLANAIRIKVGYPLSPNTTSSQSIAEYYGPVQIDKNNFFQNILSSQIGATIQGWSELEKPRNVQEWSMFPPTVNAYYNPSGNEIVFPAGILQPPFFSRDWQEPGYLSYGSFGAVAGHELTHAFDSSGRLYNQDGKIAQWWTNATSQNFEVKEGCIVKQYSAYTIDDGQGGVVHVNGNQTATENIGDSGLIQSFRAWKAQYKTSLEAGGEYLLPGLNYTREQLFFMSFARIWASVNRPEEAVLRIRSDPHSPERYRVEGTLFDIPDFAKAFDCPVGSKLNPPRDEQCIFWG
ncbi:Endothelin-converting enzyme 2, partial [Leucoagaricus sp. SymC.cos]